MKTKRHRVRVETPHKTSMAALVLLCRQYAEQELQRWLTFRDMLLDEAMERDGKLVCVYCDRDDLIPDVPESGRQPANLATIDHIYPVSKGGGRFERENTCIACYPCNQKKADKVPK